MAVTGALAALARRCGVETSYHRIDGALQEATPEAVTAVLQALGVPLERPRRASEALRSQVLAQWRQVLEPVAVAWDGAPAAPTLRVPERRAGEVADCRLTSPDGSVSTWRVRVGDLPVVGAEDAGGSRFLAKRLPTPEGVPAGVHRLDVALSGALHSCTVIGAPRRGASARTGGDPHDWGVVAPLAGLHGSRSWGVGDLGDLADLARWAAGQGASTVATLPLLPAFLADPLVSSPYLPVSRRFWNELYVDVERVPDLLLSSRTSTLLGSAEVRAEIERLRALPSVDLRGAMALKRRILGALELGLADGPSSREAAFRSFLVDHPEVSDYARFRAAGERFGADWRRWPQRLRDGSIEFADVDPQADSYHRYVQWIAHEQLTELGAEIDARGQALALDLPVGVHPFGYDVWRDQGEYALGAVVGAPPDVFQPAGQRWDFPPPHPQASRAGGHRQLRLSLDHHLSLAAVLRLDHVMALHRLFWIPEGFDAADGVYVRYPAEELWAVVSLAAASHDADVVGEDLGAVPDEVREAMGEHAARRMHVAQFGVHPERDPAVDSAPPGSTAFFGTHDTPTFAGWWTGAGPTGDDADRRARQREALWHAGGESGSAPAKPTRRALDCAYRQLAEGPAGTVMVTLEDLWLEPKPQNVPGTDTPDNWTRRAHHAVDDVGSVRDVANTLAVLATERPWQPAASRPPEVVPAGGTDFGVSLLTTDDLHLFNEGRHFQLHRKLGAHPISADGREGTYFAVWAPDASAVSAIGDWNGWQEGRHPLRPVQSSGLWEGFVPDVGAGARYKYRIRSRFGGHVMDKADPFAFRAEEPPATASVIWDLEHEWQDEDWMVSRGRRHRLDQPLSVYEVHLGSWRRVPGEGDRFLGYREIAPLLADYCQRLGFTHVELLPVMEHPFYGSWGYQTTGYFAATSRYGSPQDLMALIDHLHQRGIGVILDWVPSHFPNDPHALAFFDGTHLFEHADPRKRVHPDWGSYEFNYGRNEVRSFLVSAALFWLEQYHADGLRTDAVASMLYLDYSRREGQWVPNRYGGRENLEAVDFLRVCNTEVGTRFPDVLTFAEESTSWPGVTRSAVVGGLGFNYKWDLGWMHDTLDFMARDPIYRGWHLDALTFRGLYAYSERFVLTLSHDEVVHGKGSLLAKMPGDPWQQLANLRLLMGYQHGMPGKKLLFAGAEIGQRSEWNHDSSLDWHLLEQPDHVGLLEWLSVLNHLHRDVPALHELDDDGSGFEWVECRDRETAVMVWLRWGRDRSDPVLMLANFTPVPRYGYRVGVPFDGDWQVIAHGDEHRFGGSGFPVPTRCTAGEPPAQDRPYGLTIDLPPLALVVLRRAGAAG